jgi:hypothetical protein
MGLPTGEVSLNEVMGWAQEQTEHLRSPASRLVLWYLCINAFRHPDNPEGRDVGDVLSAYTPIARICAGTALGARTVRDALTELQEEGFILADMKRGRGQSRITVFWNEHSDQIRADYRRGIRDLPKGFKRVEQTPQVGLSPVSEATILQFPNRQDLPL